MIVTFIVFLMYCDCKCSIALPDDVVGLSAVEIVVCPVYTAAPLLIITFLDYHLRRKCNIYIICKLDNSYIY